MKLITHIVIIFSALIFGGTYCFAVRAPTRTPEAAKAYKEKFEREKNKTVENINLIKQEYKHKCSDETLVELEQLFLENNIDMENLLIIRAEKDRSPLGEQIHVRVMIFHKNLPDFNSRDPINFVNGQIRGRMEIRRPPDEFPIEPAIDMDAAVDEAKAYFFGVTRFSAELGLIHSNVRPQPVNFQLVWKIRTESVKKYPYVEVDAQTGKVIRFDNGIRY